MNIGEAVNALKAGKKVTRSEGWHGKHYLQYVNPEDIYVDGDVFHAESLENFPEAKELRPFVGIVPSNDPMGITPWLCSQADLLADDWEVFED